MASSRSGGDRGVLRQAPMLWIAAALELAIATEIAVAPALFEGASYAPIKPWLGAAAVLFAAGGLLCAFALAGVLPPRIAALAPAIAALPLALLSYSFAEGGFLTGVVTYSALAVALLWTARLSREGSASRARMLVLTAGAIVFLVGVTMVLAPSSYASAESYASLRTYLWLFAPLFMVGGGGLIAAELGPARRVMLAFASLTALDLAVLVGIFATTHLWTEVLVYGSLAAILLLSAPRISVARESPSLFAALAATACVGDLFEGLVISGGGTPLVPGWAIMRPVVAIALFCVSVGFGIALTQRGERLRLIAVGLGLTGLSASLWSLREAVWQPTDPEGYVAALLGRVADDDMSRVIGTTAVIVALSAVVLILCASGRLARLTTQALAMFGVLLSGFVALNILAYMLDSEFLMDVYGGIAIRQHATVAFGALALGIIATGATRLLSSSIGDRVIGLLGALAVLVLTRSYIADAALSHLYVDTVDILYPGYHHDVVAAQNLMLALIAGVTVASGIVFTRTVTQPLQEVIRAIARTRAGEARAHAEVEGDDELGVVARSFNTLTRELADQSELAQAMRQAQSDLGEGLMILEHGEPRQWNEALCAITGYADTELRAMDTLFSLCPPDERDDVAAVLRARSNETYKLETRFQTRDGEMREIEIAIIPLPGMAAGQQLAVARDVSERKRAERDLERRALYDGVTELPNRALFADRLARTIAAARRANDSFSLLYLDLDRFKQVNDALGHEAGDALLREVAVRLRSAIASSDTLARFGGDEFAILLPHARDEIEAFSIGEVIRAVLMRPFDLAEHRLFVEASIGAVQFPSDGEDADTLLRRADSAMYAAKRSGKGFAAYHAEHDPQSQRRLDLLSDLRQALVRDELSLHYQPQVRIGNGCLSVEALLRWRHPTRGMVPPSEFIPLAEESGLINDIALFVLRESMRQISSLGVGGVDGPQVAINLSTRNLHLPGLVEAISAGLSASGLPATALTIEITETAVMSDAKRSLETLTALAELGVRLSIDDFGSGYSSLGYLRRLPVKELKIDRGFVAEMLADRSSDAIVTSTINLGHALGLDVVAEGVEDAATLDALADRGCDLAQGYHIARPMPFEELGDWLRKEKAARGPRVMTAA